MLMMLDFSDHTRTGISILTEAALMRAYPLCFLIGIFFFPSALSQLKILMAFEFQLCKKEGKRHIFLIGQTRTCLSCLSFKTGI